MQKLSTGDDATLGNYRKLAIIFFGSDSEAVKFLDDKIAENPKGENEEVIVDEGQMVHLLGTITWRNHVDTKMD
jgi:hypothetical protein